MAEEMLVYGLTKVGSFQIQDYRIQTFADFPKNENIDVKTLSSSGYHYLNHDTEELRKNESISYIDGKILPKIGAIDRCICHFCGAVAENITSTEEAMAKHLTTCNTSTNITYLENRGLYQFLTIAAWNKWGSKVDRKPIPSKIAAELNQSIQMQLDPNFRMHCAAEIILMINKNFKTDKTHITDKLAIYLGKFLSEIENDTYFMPNNLKFQVLSRTINKMVEEQP